MSEILPVLILPYSNSEAQSAELFFKRLHGLDDSVAETETEADDAFSKFVQDAELAAQLKLPPAAAAQRVHNFEIEIADVNAHFSNHYNKIASDAAKAGEKPAAGDPHRLEKRAGKTIEETIYPSGRKVIAELENGIVVKTYAVEA